MIYKITEVVDDQTSNGKPMKRLIIEGVAKKLNIFSDFPHYSEIIAGSTIDGEIRKNDKGYDNLYSNEIKNAPRASQGLKTAQIEKSMERKEASIGKFQDNREWAVMTASSMTNAVNLAIAEYKDKTVLDTLDQAVLKWRKFILDNWSVDEKDIQPF